MQSNLAIINRVIAEHQRIREQITLAGTAINDMEALFWLQRAFSSWSQSSIDALVEKQKQLQQTIGSLAEGLDKHFGFEERALPPLFGELLMKALIYEHNLTRGKINEAKVITADTKLEGLSRSDLLSKKAYVQEIVNKLCQMIEEHAAREETILLMLRRVLEAEADQSKSAT